MANNERQINRGEEGNVSRVPQNTSHYHRPVQVANAGGYMMPQYVPNMGYNYNYGQRMGREAHRESAVNNRMERELGSQRGHPPQTYNYLGVPSYGGNIRGYGGPQYSTIPNMNNSRRMSEGGVSTDHIATQATQNQIRHSQRSQNNVGSTHDPGERVNYPRGPTHVGESVGIGIVENGVNINMNSNTNNGNNSNRVANTQFSAADNRRNGESNMFDCYSLEELRRLLAMCEKNKIIQQYKLMLNNIAEKGTQKLQTLGEHKGELRHFTLEDVLIEEIEVDMKDDQKELESEEMEISEPESDEEISMNLSNINNSIEEGTNLVPEAVKTLDKKSVSRSLLDNFSSNNCNVRKGTHRQNRVSKLKVPSIPPSLPIIGRDILGNMSANDDQEEITTHTNTNTIITYEMAFEKLYRGLGKWMFHDEQIEQRIIDIRDYLRLQEEEIDNRKSMARDKLHTLCTGIRDSEWDCILKAFIFNEQHPKEKNNKDHSKSVPKEQRDSPNSQSHQKERSNSEQENALYGFQQKADMMNMKGLQDGDDLWNRVEMLHKPISSGEIVALNDLLIQPKKTPKAKEFPWTDLKSFNVSDLEDLLSIYIVKAKSKKHGQPLEKIIHSREKQKCLTSTKIRNTFIEENHVGHSQFSVQGMQDVLTYPLPDYVDENNISTSFDEIRERLLNNIQGEGKSSSGSGAKYQNINLLDRLYSTFITSTNHLRSKRKNDKLNNDSECIRESDFYLEEKGIGSMEYNCVMDEFIGGKQLRRGRGNKHLVNERIARDLKCLGINIKPGCIKEIPGEIQFRKMEYEKDYRTSRIKTAEICAQVAKKVIDGKEIEEGYITKFLELNQGLAAQLPLLRKTMLNKSKKILERDEKKYSLTHSLNIGGRGQRIKPYYSRMKPTNPKKRTKRRVILDEEEDTTSHNQLVENIVIKNENKGNNGRYCVEYINSSRNVSSEWSGKRRHKKKCKYWEDKSGSGQSGIYSGSEIIPQLEGSPPTLIQMNMGNIFPHTPFTSTFGLMNNIEIQEQQSSGEGSSLFDYDAINTDNLTSRTPNYGARRTPYFNTDFQVLFTNYTSGLQNLVEEEEKDFMMQNYSMGEGGGNPINYYRDKRRSRRNIIREKDEEIAGGINYEVIKGECSNSNNIQENMNINIPDNIISRGESNKGDGSCSGEDVRVMIELGEYIGERLNKGEGSSIICIESSEGISKCKRKKSINHKKRRVFEGERDNNNSLNMNTITQSKRPNSSDGRKRKRATGPKEKEKSSRIHIPIIPNNIPSISNMPNIPHVPHVPPIPTIPPISISISPISPPHPQKRLKMGVRNGEEIFVIRKALPTGQYFCQFGYEEDEDYLAINSCTINEYISYSNLDSN